MQFIPAGISADPEAEDERRAAMGYMTEAFAEARLDGLDGDSVCQAAIFTALVDMVACYGEEATADYAARLAQRIRGGEFTLPRPTH